jgi:probable FeS assembly SUF system protein SufT
LREARTLARAIEVVLIPYGEKIQLEAGSTVYLTQALGGSYTALTERGYMVRIDGQDAEAIGEAPLVALRPQDVAGRDLREVAWDLLKTCYDPEIPVNIVDLGLVYQCDVEPLTEGASRVTVRFTLTAPGCGMGDYLKQDVEEKIKGIPGVREAEVEVVLDPPWDQSRMSDAARLQLGLM